MTTTTAAWWRPRAATAVVVAVRVATAAGAGALLLTLAACGGGSPLLHPARVLPGGDVRASAGFSSNLALGSQADALRDARAVAASGQPLPGNPGTNPTYARGALVAASIAPGITPFVAARVGIGHGYEGGLAYTGRGARVDARRAIELGDSGLTLSLGLGGSAAFYGRTQGGTLPAVELSSLRGYGADAPVLVGWESDAGLYKAWLGARGGFEHAVIETLTSEPRSTGPGTLVPTPVRLEGDRFYAGGVFGFAAGFRHVHVAMEISVAYQTVTGTYNGTSATVSGLTATPATALWFGF